MPYDHKLKEEYDQIIGDIIMQYSKNKTQEKAINSVIVLYQSYYNSYNDNYHIDGDKNPNRIKKRTKAPYTKLITKIESFIEVLKETPLINTANAIKELYELQGRLIILSLLKQTLSTTDGQEKKKLKKQALEILGNAKVKNIKLLMADINNVAEHLLEIDTKILKSIVNKFLKST